jgi:hypothetical protein
MAEDTSARHWTHLDPKALAEMPPEEYVEQRLNQYRAWYDGKATTSKRNYLRMRVATVVGGALVPVLINLDVTRHLNYLTTVISLAVVVLVSLESVYHFREQWKNYRSTEQSLAREYFYFSTGEGPYTKAEDPRSAFVLFVERVEHAIETENASTLNVMTTVSEAKVHKPPIQPTPN